MSGLNERDRRLFLAARAESLKSRGLSYRKFSKNMGISTHTLQKGLEELHSGHSLGKDASAGTEEAVTPRCPSIRNGCGCFQAAYSKSSLVVAKLDIILEKNISFAGQPKTFCYEQTTYHNLDLGHFGFHGDRMHRS